MALHFHERGVEFIALRVALNLRRHAVNERRSLLLKQLSVGVIVFERNAGFAHQVVVEELRRRADRVGAPVSHTQSLAHVGMYYTFTTDLFCGLLLYRSTTCTHSLSRTVRAPARRILKSFQTVQMPHSWMMSQRIRSWT